MIPTESHRDLIFLHIDSDMNLCDAKGYCPNDSYGIMI